MNITKCSSRLELNQRIIATGSLCHYRWIFTKLQPASPLPEQSRQELAGKFKAKGWKLAFYRGYDESGASGFLRGAYKGVIGAILSPIVNALETSAGVAERIRDRVIGPPEIVPRLRPPRYVSSIGALDPYDRNEVLLSELCPPPPPSLCLSQRIWAMFHIQTDCHTNAIAHLE